MSRKCCSEEFKLCNFGFKYEEAGQFYKLQWTDRRSAYLIYRVVIASYMLVWLIYELATSSEDVLRRYHRYFTNLQVVFINLYFIASAAVVAYGFFKQRSAAKEEELTGAERVEEVRFFHKIIVLLQTFSFGSAIVTAVVYWTLLASADPNVSTAINFHTHAVTLAVMTIDVLLVRFPVRILHGAHMFAVGAAYIFYTWLLHLAGDTSAVYPFLDWKHPGLVVGIGTGLTAFGGIVAQPINFALFRLRVYIHSHCSSSSKQSSSPDHVESFACHNPTFNEQTV